jgi:glycosyltransferase involved in cell wall biosynthesis
MMLNVLYVNPTAKMSGAEFSLLALLRKLDKRNIRPFLVLPEDGPLAAEAKKRGVAVSLVPGMIRFGESHAPVKIVRFTRSLKQIGAIIKSNAIHLVHSNSPRAGFTGGAAARWNGIPSVVHVRDIHLSPFADPFKAGVLDFLSDAVIAVSQATRESVVAKKRSLQKKTVVVYNGLDFENIEKISPTDLDKEFGFRNAFPYLAAVGILHPAKGYHTAVRACAMLKPHFPEMKCLIIGDGKTGLLVDPGSPRQFTDALLRLLRNPEEAARLGEAARRNARAKFDIEIHADKIVEVYRGLMGRAA